MKTARWFSKIEQRSEKSSYTPLHKIILTRIGEDRLSYRL